MKGKTVLVRVDFNIPLHNNKIVDDYKIRETVPTIKKLLRKKAKIVLVTHLGRPQRKEKGLSTKLLVSRLQKLLKRKIKFVDDCVGTKVKKKIKSLQEQDILLLENIRFHKEEIQNNKKFAKQLASLADMYVVDAFGSLHNKHASIVSVPKYIGSYRGLLVQKELRFLKRTLKHPYVVILGGGKVDTKFGLIKALLKKADAVLIGGAIMFTFIKAQGYGVGKNVVNNEDVKQAKKLLANKKLVLPLDVIVAKSKRHKGMVVHVQHIPDDMVGLDIGPESIRMFAQYIQEAKTIVSNGPVGWFEKKQFSKGTNSIAQEMVKSKGVSIVGGGDMLLAVKKLRKKFTHASTGGGALLHYVQGKTLPGLILLKRNL